MSQGTAVAPLSSARRVRGIVGRVAGQPVVRTLGPFVPVIAVWWYVAEAEVFPSAFFVGPDAVVRRLWELVYMGILPGYLADSVTRLLTGAVVGLVIGLPAGFLIGVSRFVRRLAWPPLVFFQAVADIAWLPILVIWFGFSLTSVTFVIVYSIVFPLVLGVVAGVAAVPRDLYLAAGTLGAGRWRRFVEVTVPGALPSVATGVRTGLGYGVRALIAAEIIVGTSGLGFMMFDARRAGEVTEVFVGMAVLGALWYAADTLLLASLEHSTVERWGMVRKAGEA